MFTRDRFQRVRDKRFFARLRALLPQRPRVWEYDPADPMPVIREAFAAQGLAVVGGVETEPGTWSFDVREIEPRDWREYRLPVLLAREVLALSEEP